MPRRRKAAAQDLTAEELEHFQKQAESHRSTENAWQRLTDAGEDDGWSHVEENIIAKDHQQANADRRWKFFAK
jgi:hypothetical protein